VPQVIIQSDLPVEANTFKVTQLNNLTLGAPLATGPLNGAFALLFTNNIQVSPQTVLADLVQPTVTQVAGYAAQPLTFFPAYQETLTKAQMDAHSVQFPSAAADLGVTIYGYGVMDSTKANLLFSETLSTPVQLGPGLDAITLEVSLMK
jgi:hypothetical protein